MIDNTELERVTEQPHTAKEDFNKLKNELKKPPTVENMIKATDSKRLQQQVTKLHIQKQKRAYRVVEL